MTPAPFGAGRVRRAVPRLLREGEVFRSYWGAHTISLFGDQVSLLALPLVAVLALDADAAQMGYLTAFALAPNLLLALHAGAWVDRHGHRRRTMIAADIGRAGVIATVRSRTCSTRWPSNSFSSWPSSPACSPYCSGSWTRPCSRRLCHGIASSRRATAQWEPAFLSSWTDDRRVPCPGVHRTWRAPPGRVLVPGVRSASRTNPPGGAAPDLEQKGVMVGLRGRGSARALDARCDGHDELLQLCFGRCSFSTRHGTLGVSPGTLAWCSARGPSAGFLAWLWRGPGAVDRRRPDAPRGSRCSPCRSSSYPSQSGRTRRLRRLFRRSPDGNRRHAARHQRGCDLRGDHSAQAPPRVSGAYSFVNYGIRVLGSLAGGLLGSAIGVRPTLWIGAAGALLGGRSAPVARTAAARPTRRARVGAERSGTAPPPVRGRGLRRS